MAETNHADVKKLSFEKAIEELESIVKRLEEGKVPLEESVAIYERGEALKRRCERCCARPRRGWRRSPSTPPANRKAPSRWMCRECAVIAGYVLWRRTDSLRPHPSRRTPSACSS